MIERQQKKPSRFDQKPQNVGTGLFALQTFHFKAQNAVIEVAKLAFANANIPSTSILYTNFLFELWLSYSCRFCLKEM